MKASQYLLPTTKQDPQDAVVESHKLMIRAGLVRKLGAGLYHYLPMGLRVLRKIERIIREEMDAAGALEFQLPILTPAELWVTSGRWDRMGKEMFRLKDRHENPHCLGPTHEESFCALMKPILRSYKDLPKNVYQIHTKFRDEIRPRFGVIRSREFIMKDAYSFHLDETCLESTYETMRVAYRKIFKRMGLDTIPVQADSGNMGGAKSEEFMVVSPIGEETLMLCSSCGYSGNVEKTPLVSSPETASVGPSLLSQPSLGEKVYTPGLRSIDELSFHFQVSAGDCLKALAYLADGAPVLIFTSGDRDLNEAKLKSYLQASEIRAMTQEEMAENRLVPGFIGPGLENRNSFRILVDRSVDLFKEYIAGANEKDYHVRRFVWGGLPDGMEQADLVLTRAGDPCPSCGAALRAEKGIELGHIFQLGKKYTEAFEIQVLDDKGKPRLLIMGCYGIGVNRCMAAIIEQCNDEKGIFWPISVAPFEVCIVSIAKSGEEIWKIAEVYEGLMERGLDVFWDDRDLGPGFKFKDSELVGFPIRLTLGKSFLEKKEITILNRRTGEEKNIVYEGLEGLLSEIYSLREALYRELEAEGNEKSGTSKKI